MEGSKEYLKKNSIFPRISFKTAPVHEVVLLKDKQDQIPGGDGKVVLGMNYLVEENGEKKTFFTSSDALISALSEFAEGSRVVIELKSRKTDTGYSSYYEVRHAAAPTGPTPVGEDGEILGKEDIPF